MNQKPFTVLIVDDTLENLRVLGEMLELDGHEVRIASQGAQALEMARLSPPDLILLDVMMPGMDGHEVCRRLKADPLTLDIPVIFLTALTDEADEALGLDLGAVDYVTKPFKMNLVRKRIQNHLSLRQLQRELREYNDRLEELVTIRTRDLSKANQKLTALGSTKSLFLRLLAQEVQAPANGMVGIGQLALKSIEDPAKRQRLESLFENNKNRLDTILHQYQRLVAFQEAAPSARLHPLRLEDAVQEAWKRAEPLGSAKELSFPPPPPRSYIVAADPELLTEALVPLVLLLVEAAEPGAVFGCRFEEQGGSILCGIEVSSREPLAEGFKPIEELNLGENLPLSAVVVGSLSGTALLGPGLGSTWELRVEFPAYRP